MQAQPTKVPFGGSFWLFIAGLLLEAGVSTVAARATVMDVLQEQGFEVPEPQVQRAPKVAETLPTPAPAPVAEGPQVSMESIQERITIGKKSLEKICYANLGAEVPPDSSWTMKISILPHGAVDTVTVEGPGGAMRACMEAEVSTWQFGNVGTTLNMSRTIRF